MNDIQMPILFKIISIMATLKTLIVITSTTVLSI